MLWVKLNYYFSVIPVKIRIIFSRASRGVNKEYPLKEVLKDFSHVLSENIIVKENYLSNYYYKENQINKPFIPSITAQNGLNFITKENENFLFESLSKNQSINLINTFKFIHILLCKDVEIPDVNLLDNLFQKIFFDLKADSFSK